MTVVGVGIPNTSQVRVTLAPTGTTRSAPWKLVISGGDRAGERGVWVRHREDCNKMFSARGYLAKLGYE